jgi:hypothetical protein
MSGASIEDVCRLAQALACNCGYSVFPCRDNKSPACPHGFTQAAHEPDAIAELWRRWPGPLIGIATGSRSGIAVLDCDRKHAEAVVWWQRNYHRLLPTRTYATRSGGLHLYFCDRAGVGNTQGKLCRGVDTRGDGGYVISWFAAGFECPDPTPPQPFPDWLFTALTYRPPVPPVAARPINCDRAIDGIVRKLAGAKEGDRNALLFWAACRLAEHRVGQTEAEALLIPIATSMGLTDREARQTIRSAMRRVAA